MNDELTLTDCPQCEGAGEVPKMGVDEDGYAIQDLWKICSHCEYGMVCAYCEEKPSICKVNGQCVTPTDD